MERDAEGQTALDGILEDVGKRGVFLMLGSGDPDLEQQFADACRRHCEPGRGASRRRGR